MLISLTMHHFLLLVASLFVKKCICKLVYQDRRIYSRPIFLYFVSLTETLTPYLNLINHLNCYKVVFTLRKRALYVLIL